MKYFVGLVCILCISSGVRAECVQQPVNAPHAFSRGVANVLTCWLEIPRGIVYENARIPLVGMVVGPIKGAVLTTARVCAGTLDIVAMGLTREGLHSPMFPEYVWDATWIPAYGERFISPDVTEKMDVSSCPSCSSVDCDPASARTGFLPSCEEVRCVPLGEDTPWIQSATAEEIPFVSPEKKAPSAQRTTFDLSEGDDMRARIDKIEENVRLIEELALLLGRH